MSSIQNFCPTLTIDSIKGSLITVVLLNLFLRITFRTIDSWVKIRGYSLTTMTKWIIRWYSSNKITKNWIQISCQNWNCLFSNSSHQMMILLSPIVSKSKRKGYRWQKIKIFALNSQLQLYQILTNDDQMLILCTISYFKIRNLQARPSEPVLDWVL